MRNQAGCTFYGKKVSVTKKTGTATTTWKKNQTLTKRTMLTPLQPPKPLEPWTRGTHRRRGTTPGSSPCTSPWCPEQAPGGPGSCRGSGGSCQPVSRKEIWNASLSFRPPTETRCLLDIGRKRHRLGSMFPNLIRFKGTTKPVCFSKWQDWRLKEYPL